MLSRKRVRVVLHTSHPVPGLRVDELSVVSERQNLNEFRRQEAKDRIIAAAQTLSAQGKDVTMSAVAREAKAHKATVAKVLGTSVHTPRRDGDYLFHAGRYGKVGDKI